MHLEFQQEVTEKTTGTHRHLDLTCDRVTFVLIGRVDQMTTELVLSLGTVEPLGPCFAASTTVVMRRTGRGHYLETGAKKGLWTRCLYFRQNARLGTLTSRSGQKSGKHVL